MGMGGWAFVRTGDALSFKVYKTTRTDVCWRCTVQTQSEYILEVSTWPSGFGQVWVLRRDGFIETQGFEKI